MFKRNLIAALVVGAVLPVCLHSTDALSATSKKSKTELVEKADSDIPVFNITVPKQVPGSSEIAASLGANTLRKYTFTLKQLGAYDPLALRGIDAVFSLPFSVPADEVVTGLKLKLDFAYSPSLITNLSHLKILVNGEIAATVALPKEQAGTNLIREVTIDPRLLTDFNRFNMQFIGHYTLDCEDPFHSSLWMNISNLSTLEFTVTPLSVQNDLALLPAPFFDRRDGRRLELPFVFGGTPSSGVLEAAGIVSSWFGSLASYRGAWFPSSLNALPAAHAVVFATNEERPQGISVPPINGPTLAVAPHPSDPRYKMLFVLGRDAKELRTAATALGLGRNTFSGQSVAITGLEGLKVRKPYDAPNWVTSDRPVKMGELASVEEMNVTGIRPDLIRVNLRTAPDLFGWQSKGAPFDMRYRYTPRATIDKSTLNVNVNRNFITAYPLLPFSEGQPGEAIQKKINNLLNTDKLLPARDEFFIPLSLMPARSQLQFHYHFDYPKQGACKDVEMKNYQGAIDPESTLDLTSFPHYIEMPNIAVFANAGFPFTRMADLSETAVVMPDAPGVPDISTYLTLMGRMGESTGLPAYGISVGRAGDVSRYADKDLLVLGSSANQPMLGQWAKHMPFSVAGQARTFSISEWVRRHLPWYETVGTDRSPVVKLSEITLNREAVVFGFESPLSSGRSVVAVVSDKTSGLADVLSALMDDELIAKIQGSLAVVRGKEVESMTVGSAYTVGKLPFALKSRWLISQNSWMLALALIAGAVLLGAVLYTLLRLRVNRRTKG
ncbi:MAG: cellulose biosynthesis cyclic di-GMP-binding regulatory protein BcsB [Betaproteobacteria bacterium]|nr:cellulose biosynthesis cyclic di-GMP-binding regulatory protein BcsB [Betaproteobacteria bacterium]